MIGSILVSVALRKVRRRHGPHPRGAAASAQALWSHLTTGSPEVCAPLRMLVPPPSMDRVAEGAVALARYQAERGIRTIVGRTLAGGGGG